MAATSLVDRIKAQSEYSWANNEHNLGGFQSALAALDGDLSDARQEFLMQDQKTMVETLGSSR